MHFKIGRVVIHGQLVCSTSFATRCSSGKGCFGTLSPTASHRRPQPRHHVGWKDGCVDDSVEGGGRFTSAHVNFSPVVTPGRSPIRGWRPLLPSLRSHPPGSSEFVVGLTATSGNFLSRPSGRLFMPGPREPANFPSSASPTACSAWGVDSVEGIQGKHGTAGKTCEGPIG